MSLNMFTHSLFCLFLGPKPWRAKPKLWRANQVLTYLFIRRLTIDLIVCVKKGMIKKVAWLLFGYLMYLGGGDDLLMYTADLSPSLRYLNGMAHSIGISFLRWGRFYADSLNNVCSATVCRTKVILVNLLSLLKSPSIGEPSIGEYQMECTVSGSLPKYPPMSGSKLITLRAPWILIK